MIPAYGDDGSNGGRRNASFNNLSRGTKDTAAVFCGDHAEHKDTDERRAGSPSGGKTKAVSATFGSPESERQRGSQKLPRPPTQSTSPFSRPSSAARAPACSCSSALLQAGKQGAGGIKKAKRLPRVPGHWTNLLPTRHTVVLAVLLSWAAFFGVGTVRRCRDWNSERALFESAIKVCPDGIKTLNNMAASMLNQEEAGRAEALLLRAVEVCLGGSGVAVAQASGVETETGAHVSDFF